MAAASNQWAAVGDAVNSASLVQMGVTIVQYSLAAVGAWGTWESVKLVTRGPGGYTSGLTELETIIEAWDYVLRNLAPDVAARIDAEAGPGSVALMHIRLTK